MRARVEIGPIGSADGGMRRVANLRYVGRANVSPTPAHHQAPDTKSKRSFNPSQSVAVKVVTKKGIQKASEILVKEIKILRELTALHHTNLVAMHDCMDSPSYVYVVMELQYAPIPTDGTKSKPLSSIKGWSTQTVRECSELCVLSK
ncbi:Serine/threonine-protein kinase unc-51 [Papilio xuthus]|uniref:Serine/threonine-protein kinase unc-51 n=1 Tax=Papilio xuthus TaxID=66420 RepID=A0A194PQK8_PAPXU|nr:Serine/threonine-protein kinase unc-51 [Papilio xuthus]